MLPRFHHIAVPVDFTARNRAALDVAFELGSVNRSRVTLLHVVEHLDIETDVELQDFYNRMQQRARGELDRLSQRFTAGGLATHAIVLFGKRGAQIIEFVREHQVDLVVMSSHPPDETQPLKSLVTISSQVSLAAPCSVLLIKGGSPPSIAAQGTMSS